MIDFHGFSPESFQQLIGLLSLQVFGEGATLFGRGPDGGRDVSFRGRVPYPFGKAQCWDGYGVVQAKFKSKRETTQQDQHWAETQLAIELELWREDEKRSPKPDYLVFATNVELTAASGGGRDRLESLLGLYAREQRLKGYAVWDANQLRGLIDSHPIVRERFAALFTPGDLLAALAKRLPQLPDADAVLGNFLASGLVADENARLGQTGDRSQSRMQLSRLFIDLPYSNNVHGGPPAAPPQDKSPLLCLRRLARAASQKLDPRTLYEQGMAHDVHFRSSPEPSDLEDRACGHFLLVGGPGSGKSTIGQFLAQIHRAALLDRRPPHRLDPRLREIIDALKARCAEDLVDWPTTPRFSFRIELSGFAKAMDASDPATAVATLSEYLRRQLSRNTPLTHETLRQWLRAHPWLLVLDGLDEVPSASNRKQVISALQDFLTETRDLEADLLVVASTRPEGYDGEFDGSDVRTLYLSPLPPVIAQQCAKRYVAAKIPVEDEARTRDVLVTLTEAISSPLTGKLMTSPLQVTFMVTVVAASGKPSESRWQLLSDYFRIIYDRELQKAVPPFNRVLGRRRPVIEALHHRVGFVLQSRAEHSGETQADLALEDFEALVDQLLREDGLDGQELARERDEIVGAANLRLVFLTSRSAGRLSFEVRSLQEYMAAAFLTQGDMVHVMKRLETIAHSAYWRNTLFFAIGRFFDDVHFRDHRGHIRLLCEDLNRDEALRASVRLGSRLALEILENGGAAEVPSVSRSLVANALQLLDLPAHGNERLPQRLSNVYEPAMEAEFRKAATTFLGMKDLLVSMNTWLLLLFLEQKPIRWASELIATHWPSQEAEAGQLLSAQFAADRSLFWQDAFCEQHARRLEAHCANLPVRECSQLVKQQMRMWGIRAEQSWLAHLIALVGNIELEDAYVPIESLAPIGLRVNTLQERSEAADAICQLIGDGTLRADWPKYTPVFEFIHDPRAATLAAALRCFAFLDEPIATDFWLSIVPWPLACCLAHHPDRDSLAALAQTAGRALGDVDRWRAAEQRWSEGFRFDELFKPVAAALAAPFQAHHYAMTGMEFSDKDRARVEKLLDRLQASPGEAVRNSLVVAIASAMSIGSFGAANPDFLQLHLAASLPALPLGFLTATPDEFAANPRAWAAFYDWLGRQPNINIPDPGSTFTVNPLRTLLEEFLNDPERWGLLRLAAFWSAHDSGVSPQSLQRLRCLRTNFDCEWARQLLLTCDDSLREPESAEIGRQLTALIPSSSAPQRLLEVTIAAMRMRAKDTAQAILTALVELVARPEYAPYAADIEHLRYTMLQAQLSGLDESCLNSLQLTAH